MIDVLVPTYRRPEALALTLGSLVWQDAPAFRVLISDQSGDRGSTDPPVVSAVLRLLESRGIRAGVFDGPGGKGIAANRQFLLSLSSAPRCLFLDDDLLLEPDLIARLDAMMDLQQCGFVGSAPIGLSFAGDHRPREQRIEFWTGRVLPERIRPGTPQWERHLLHNAANIFHLQRRLGLTGRTQRAYKVAWIGSCVLFDSAKLRDCGGFDFWEKLPDETCGEDVYAQIRVMEKYGGCGIIPSGVYHQELPTTIPNRDHNALSLLARVSPGR